jgi:hypothetical protein
MARRINIVDIGDFCEERMNQLMHVVVFETDAELKSQSPVDTGRFSLVGLLAKMQQAITTQAPGDRWRLCGSTMHQEPNASAIPTTCIIHCHMLKDWRMVIAGEHQQVGSTSSPGR